MRLSQSRFTVSAGAVIFRDDGRLLLLEHRFRPGSGLGIPGGFIGKGEQPEAALRRELCEETGLELTDIEFLTTRTIDTHVEVIFIARANGDIKLAEFEIISAEWVDPAKLPTRLSRGQREMIARALDRKPF
jgi:ADP-ribose pyrophosphatase YjhB (NUDIX family)